MLAPRSRTSVWTPTLTYLIFFHLLLTSSTRCRCYVITTLTLTLHRVKKRALVRAGHADWIWKWAVKVESRVTPRAGRISLPDSNPDQELVQLQVCARGDTLDRLGVGGTRTHVLLRLPRWLSRAAGWDVTMSFTLPLALLLLASSTHTVGASRSCEFICFITVQTAGHTWSEVISDYNHIHVAPLLDV